MTASHLIAVNCHEFHREEDIALGLSSVAAAIEAFRGHHNDPVHVRVYWHGPHSPRQALRDQMASSGFELNRAEGRGNGPNLNRQIEDALADGFDIFFRVDGDDTVSEQRFIEQSELLMNGDCDLCGGGLHYLPQAMPGYVMQPPVSPGPRDFIENQYVLHPSMAFRLDAFERTRLRYWPRRLEDKALLLNARKVGLRIRNLPDVVGTYRVDPSARNLFSQKWLNLRLNLEFLTYSRAFGYVPYAGLLFSLHVLLGADRLRRIRYLMRRRIVPAASHSASKTNAAKPVTT